jgi:probable O-glycosylation ligase (exosortase A-associated)
MRDLVLMCGMLCYVPMSLMSPAAGLLVWEWFSLMSPHRMVYSFAYGLPLNGVIAATTLLGWLLSRERKSFPPDALPWLLLAFFAWSTFNMLLAPYPDYSWNYWDRAMRSFVPIFLVFILMTRKARIHGLIWTIVISLGFYGLKGGLFTIIHAGDGRVFGPPDTQITDNNTLALAILMELPLVFYLMQHTQHRLLRIGLQVALVLQIAAVFGSYSRGAFVAMGAMLVMFWWRSKNKILYAFVGAIVVGGALSVMPPAFWERMNSLHDVSADSSFEGRVQAWHVAFYYARDHFPFGAGYNAPALAPIFHHYLPDAVLHVAHSIYFEVLGDQGFAGLALYLPILLLALRNARIVARQTRGQPELAWAHDLANMIFVALTAYYVGGAALSMAYFDGYLLLIALTSCLREMTSPVRIKDAARAKDTARVPSFGPGHLPLPDLRGAGVAGYRRTSFEPPSR